MSAPDLEPEGSRDLMDACRAVKDAWTIGDVDAVTETYRIVDKAKGGIGERGPAALQLRK